MQLARACVTAFQCKNVSMCQIKIRGLIAPVLQRVVCRLGVKRDQLIMITPRMGGQQSRLQVWISHRSRQVLV